MYEVIRKPTSVCVKEYIDAIPGEQKRLSYKSNRMLIVI
jgi:hypothetical protein